MIEDTNEEEREKKRQELEELKGFRACVPRHATAASAGQAGSRLTTMMPMYERC